jgi:hypothetical protein
MIKYQLICDQNHEFEGWFQASAAFDAQAESGLLRCPLCDSDQVKRALMTPNLASPKRRKAIEPPLADPAPNSANPPLTNPMLANPTPAQQSALPTKSEQVQAFGAALAELRQLQQKITKDCRDVGDNFAEEARKIHYGEAEAEGIYGRTTHEEREALEDEGIDVLDMPWLPPDH